MRPQRDAITDTILLLFEDDKIKPTGGLYPSADCSLLCRYAFECAHCKWCKRKRVWGQDIHSQTKGLLGISARTRPTASRRSAPGMDPQSCRRLHFGEA